METLRCGSSPVLVSSKMCELMCSSTTVPVGIGSGSCMSGAKVRRYIRKESMFWSFGMMNNVQNIAAKLALVVQTERFVRLSPCRKIDFRPHRDGLFLLIVDMLSAGRGTAVVTSCYLPRQVL